MGGYQRRYLWLLVGFAVAFAVLLARLWSLQILHGEEYHQASTENIIRTRPIPPPRGRIFDRSGVVLAENRPSYDVYLVPHIVRENEPEEVIARLSRFLNLSRDEARRLGQEVGWRRGDIKVSLDVTRAQVALLETHQLELPGVEVRAQPHRRYPLHRIGAHTVGFMGEINARELEELEPLGYHIGDYIGRMGVERSFESVLRGSPGLERFVVDVSGQPQGEAETRFLIGDYQRVDPIQGRDLVLTLDAELMLIIDEAMREHPSGAVVALDPRDGSVLAAYSKPTFDPNSWSGRLSAQEKRRSDNDPFKPMLDKTVSAYFPGSIYKIVGAYAALEEGLLDFRDTVNCPGYYRFGGRRFRCWKYAGHGHVNLMEALQHSCDVFFYHVAEQLGIDRLAGYAYRFGFGEPTGYPVNTNAWSQGRVPTKEWHRKHSPEGFQYGFALNTVLGQGDTLVTPMHAALAYAAVANGGDIYYPRLIREIRNPDGTTLFTVPPQVRKRVPIKPEHLDAIRTGLWLVVNDEAGTAWEAGRGKIDVAGKTGTAQVHKIGLRRIANREKAYRFRDHAWFAAYGPTEDPELALAVFVEHGGHGSDVAAPVALQIFKEYFARDGSRTRTLRFGGRTLEGGAARDGDAGSTAAAEEGAE